MSFKFIFRGCKGKNSKLKQSIELKCGLYYRDPHFSSEGSSSSSYHVAQQSLWASLPAELLLDIINRVEASEITWPARRAIVSCAAVSKLWRDITQEVVRAFEECGLLTSPMLLKHSGPIDSLIQCFNRRKRATSIYRLHLDLSPGDASKLLLASKRIKKDTKIDLSISCPADDFSQTSNNYSGKLRSLVESLLSFISLMNFYHGETRAKLLNKFFGQKRGLLICYPDTASDGEATNESKGNHITVRD